MNMTKCIKEVNLGQLAGGCPRSCLLLLPSNHVVALGKLLEGSTQSKDSPRLFCRIPLYFPSALHSSWPLTLLKTDVTFHRTKFISLSAQQKLSLEQNPAETQQCTALWSHMEMTRDDSHVYVTCPQLSAQALLGNWPFQVLAEMDETSAC